MDTQVTATQVREKLGAMYDPELAEFLRISIPTLKARRSRCVLPPSSKSGREHVTLVDDLKAWISHKRAK